MQHILYVETAKRLNVSQGCLALTTANEETALIHPEDVLALVIENQYCQVSLPSIILCVQEGIPVLLCNERHQPEVYCINYYRHSELLKTITEQKDWSPERKTQCWRQIVYQKIQNQIELMHSEGADSSKTEQLQAKQKELGTLQITEDQMNAIESVSARIYFKSIFGERFKRFEADSINHALNYGYALIRAMIMVSLTVKGLHPSLGIWHHSVRNRFNLADDLIEPLRPLVDGLVLRLNLEEQLSKSDKEFLIGLLCQPVYWQKKQYSLRTAIDLYINEFVRYMNEDCDKMTFIGFKSREHDSDKLCVDDYV